MCDIIQNRKETPMGTMIDSKTATGDIGLPVTATTEEVVTRVVELAGDGLLTTDQQWEIWDTLKS